MEEQKRKEEGPYQVFVGRLGVKPKLAYTPKQTPVCTLSLGVNKSEGEKTEWEKGDRMGKAGRVL